MKNNKNQNDGFDELKDEMEKYSDFPEDKDGIKYDPQERDPRYRDIFKKAAKETEEELDKECPGLKGQMGYCYSHWETMKRILKEKYNIDWVTPQECNPHILYD